MRAQPTLECGGSAAAFPKHHSATRRSNAKRHQKTQPATDPAPEVRHPVTDTLRMD
jgi:hypothetical protein